MFLPADAALAAALEAEPTLLEALVGERVVVATPATLVALLRAVAAGWREAQAAESAREAAALGRELYARLRTLVGAFTAMRRGLDAAVEGYNRAAASLEMRVLVSARRLGALGMDDGKALDAPEAAEATPASSWPGTSR
jgi:DNA recombination protein RmuC